MDTTSQVKGYVSVDETQEADVGVEIAARTAEHLGVKYYKQHVDEEDFAAYFEDATWNSEQHYFDLGFIAKHVLSKLANSVGLKVILNGKP